MSLKHHLVGLCGLLLACCWVHAEEVRGVVVRADNNKHELVIEGKGKGARGIVFRLVLDKDTEIFVGKEKGNPTDLAPGKRVRVTFEAANGLPHALSVQVRSLPALSALPIPLGPGAVPASPTPVPATGPNTVAGTLRRVSYTDREIVVVTATGKGGAAAESTVQVPPSARITREQQSIHFNDLKEGESAVVETEKKGNQLVARSIQIGTAANAPVAPSQPPQDRKIERVRQILKMIDAALEGFANRQAP
jgi:hypothetical protein